MGVGTVAPRRYRRTAVAAAVCVLVVLELGARAVAERLPDPLEWHSYEVQRKVEQIDGRREQGADVVFLGTSMVNAAVIPSVFEDVAGGGVTAYNAGLSSSIPRLTEPWALEVVLPRLRPRLVVIGVSSLDLTDAGVARTAFFDAFLDSAGGRQVLGRERLLDRADRWLRDRSALWRHRAELRVPRLAIDAVRGREPPVDEVAGSIDDGGWVGNLAGQRFEDRPQRDGIAGVSVWSLGTEDPAALRRLVAGIRDGGATPVLVKMPVTDEYVAFHPNGERDYAAFEHAIGELASDEEVALLDLAWSRDTALFADELHLNRAGAVELTTRLAEALDREGLLPG